MADELKQKFKEMQKHKENKKEIDIDEFEWIKVVGVIPLDTHNFPFMLYAVKPRACS